MSAVVEIGWGALKPPYSATVHALEDLDRYLRDPESSGDWRTIVIVRGPDADDSFSRKELGSLLQSLRRFRLEREEEDEEEWEEEEEWGESDESDESDEPFYWMEWVTEDDSERLHTSKTHAWRGYSGLDHRSGDPAVCGVTISPEAIDIVEVETDRDECKRCLKTVEKARLALL